MKLTQRVKMMLYMSLCYVLSSGLIFFIFISPEILMSLPKEDGFLKSLKSTVEIIVFSLALGGMILPLVAATIADYLPLRFLKK